MRILFKDAENTLNCVIATHISYDDEDSTLWFYTDNQIWQTELNKIYAEARIRDAYKEGRLDLSSYICTLYEEE